MRIDKSVSYQYRVHLPGDIVLSKRTVCSERYRDGEFTAFLEHQQRHIWIRHESWSWPLLIAHSSSPSPCLEIYDWLIHLGEMSGWEAVARQVRDGSVLPEAKPSSQGDIEFYIPPGKRLRTLVVFDESRKLEELREDLWCESKGIYWELRREASRGALWLSADVAFCWATRITEQFLDFVAEDRLREFLSGSVREWLNGKVKEWRSGE